MGDRYCGEVEIVLVVSFVLLILVLSLVNDGFFCFFDCCFDMGFGIVERNEIFLGLENGWMFFCLGCWLVISVDYGLFVNCDEVF